MHLRMGGMLQSILQAQLNIKVLQLKSILLNIELNNVKRHLSHSLSLSLSSSLYLSYSLYVSVSFFLSTFFHLSIYFLNTFLVLFLNILQLIFLSGKGMSPGFLIAMAFHQQTIVQIYSSDIPPFLSSHGCLDRQKLYF